MGIGYKNVIVRFIETVRILSTEPLKNMIPHSYMGIYDGDHVFNDEHA